MYRSNRWEKRQIKKKKRGEKNSKMYYSIFVIKKTSSVFYKMCLYISSPLLTFLYLSLRIINVTRPAEKLNFIRVFVFPGPRLPAWPLVLALARNLYLTALGHNLHLPTLAPNLYIMVLAPNFYLPALVSWEPGLTYINIVPPICIYWPWPTIFITELWISIYLLIYSSRMAAVILAIVVIS